jgi:phosphoglucosamine mutase
MTDYGTTGDGLLAALRALAILKMRGQPVSSVFQAFTPVPQILQNVRYAGVSPLTTASIQDVIRQAEARLMGQGRVLVRASGTEPVIRVMAEGDDEGMIKGIVSDICQKIQGS